MAKVDEFQAVLREMRQKLLYQEQIIGEYFPGYSLSLDSLEEEAIKMALEKVVGESVSEAIRV